MTKSTLWYRIQYNYKLGDIINYYISPIKCTQYLQFEEIIMVNPHNMCIYSVSVANSIFNEVCLYQQYIFDKCWKHTYIHVMLTNIMENPKFNSKEKDEILHVTQLWLTKFVPN